MQLISKTDEWQNIRLSFEPPYVTWQTPQGIFRDEKTFEDMNEW